VLSDTLPAGFTWSEDPDKAECSIAAGVITCNVGDLGSGASFTVHVKAATTVEDCETVENPGAQATATNHPDVNAGAASVTVNCPANPQVFKVPSVNSVTQGGQFTYDIEVRNEATGGPQNAALNVELSDTLVGATIVSITDQPASTVYDCETNFSPTSFTCTIGTLDPGQFVVFRVTVRANNACTPVNNTAMVTSEGGGNAEAADDMAAANQVTVTGCNVDLTVQKGQRIGSGTTFVTSTLEVEPGDEVRYRIVIRNTGDQALTGVSLSDTLPSVFTGVTEISDPLGLCGVSGNTFSCSGISLAPGESYTVVVEATFAGSCLLAENTALGDSDQTASETSNTVQVEHPCEFVVITPTPTPSAVSTQIAGVQATPTATAPPRISEVLPSQLPATGSGSTSIGAPVWLFGAAALAIALGLVLLAVSRRRHTG
jgi:uncharacterized repeat protein (TIGR01451 family)